MNQESAKVLNDVWDSRGGFVCGLPFGHDGAHKSRPSKNRPVVSWQAVDETEAT